MSKTDDESNKTITATGFAPSDLTDGREPGIWESKYGPQAQTEIRWERNYLISIFFLSILLPAIVGVMFSAFSATIGISTVNIEKYFFAWAGGTLGGTMFASKWLYHSVAKNTWHIDRQMWRILTPHLSAALALVFIVLINSEMLNISTPKSLTIHKCFAIGFLVGYFSDNAIGKLTELAQVVFGSGLSQKR